MAVPSRFKLRQAMSARLEGGPAWPSALTLSRYTPLDLETNLFGGGISTTTTDHIRIHVRHVREDDARHDVRAPRLALLIGYRLAVWT